MLFYNFFRNRLLSVDSFLKKRYSISKKDDFKNIYDNSGKVKHNDKRRKKRVYKEEFADTSSVSPPEKKFRQNNRRSGGIRRNVVSKEEKYHNKNFSRSSSRFSQRTPLGLSRVNPNRERLVHKSGQKKRRYRVKVGQVCHIYRSNNNMFLTLTKINGEVLYQLSGGKIGKKGPKRDTPNTAELVGRRFGREFVRRGHYRCILHIHGLYDTFTKSALRGFMSNRVRVMQLVHKLPIPHNGIRFKKPRRK